MRLTGWLCSLLSWWRAETPDYNEIIVSTLLKRGGALADNVSENTPLMRRLKRASPK